jgi:hypothetical protein
LYGVSSHKETRCYSSYRTDSLMVGMNHSNETADPESLEGSRIDAREKKKSKPWPHFFSCWLRPYPSFSIFPTLARKAEQSSPSRLILPLNGGSVGIARFEAYDRAPQSLRWTPEVSDSYRSWQRTLAKGVSWFLIGRFLICKRGMWIILRSADK